MKKLFALVLTVTMFFAVAAVAFATPSPVPGQLTWNAKYSGAAVIAPSMGPDKDLPNNPRNNASGDKITSNAHSADFPGLYFYWNDKQKDNGVLLVDPAVFKMFVGGKFTLTAKNSNNYWGYEISRATGTLIDGVYAYGIAKQIKYNEIGNNGKVSAKAEDLKNINMVFIDGKYLPGHFDIVKEWRDEDGYLTKGDNSLVSFKEGFKLGRNQVDIRTYGEAIKGRTLVVTENPIPGFDTLTGPQIINVKQSLTTTSIPAKLTFVNQKQWAYIYISKYWLSECDCPVDEHVDNCCLFWQFDKFYHIIQYQGAKDLTATFTINGAVASMEYNRVKAGEYIVSEVGVTPGFRLISDNDLTVTVEPGGFAFAPFFNLKDETIVIPDKPTITVDKKWTGSPLENADSYVTFTDNYGNYYQLGADGLEVDAGTIAITETIAPITGYTIICTGIEVYATDKDGNKNPLIYGYSLDYKSVSFVAEVDMAYEVVFTNTVVKNSNAIKPGLRIESESHADNFWQYGIIAIGANTTSNGLYAVAFTENFFDTYSIVVFRYGSASESASDIYVAYTAADLANAVKQHIKFSNSDLSNGPLDCGILDVFYTDNVWGSGGKQIYLYELVYN